jgi:hypothetical protein
MPKVTTETDKGCPCCANLKLSETNSLATLFPEIAAQWHPTLNGDMTPDQVIARSSKKYWFICPEGPDHEWATALSNRTSKGTGCPYCSHKRLSITNSLTTLFPEIAAQWHPTMNSDLTPDWVIAGSDKKYWFICPEGPDHEWDANLASRTGQGIGCPCCSHHKVSVTNSLATLFPEIAAQWHPTLNGDMTPDRVLAQSNRKYWFICPEGPDHEWLAIVNNRTAKKSGCPCCHGFKPSVTNSLASLFPAVAAQWHPSLNGELTPDQVVSGSNKKYWFKCAEGPDHEWIASLHDRTGAGTGCPCCANLQLSVTNSLAMLFPEIAAQWHPTLNGDLTPDQVVSGTPKKYWFICPEGPDHEWDANLASRTGQGIGCPCCSHHKVSVTNSLATRFPEIAAQWHPTLNGDLTPDKIVAGTPRKFWWLCSDNPEHEWAASSSNRIGFSKTGCPYCDLKPRSREEIRLAFELSVLFEFDIDDHKITVGTDIYDCDIVIRDNQLIVEYDGKFYHRDRGEQDLKKTNALKAAGWNVIRVRERPLPDISQLDVSIPNHAKPKSVTDSVLLKIRDSLNIQIDGLSSYLEQTEPQNQKAAERYIRRLLASKPSA